MKLLEIVLKALKGQFVCDWCLGRICGNLLSGYSNQQRGRIIRQFIAFLIDSGEKLEVDYSNFYGIKFRNVKISVEKPSECSVCKNFFEGKIDSLAKKAVEKLDKIEFETFLVGSIPTDEMSMAEEEIWSKTGIEFVETIKSEINRELGKRIERTTDKRFSLENPDVTIIFDLRTETVRVQLRSLFIFGKYKKLKRGIPQTKWTCSRCGGKGCRYCEGKGKLYPTSVQEIIEKPLLHATGSKKSAFSGGGREDIDARCLDWRPFVIELKKPVKRKVDLKKLEKKINKSKSVKVSQLKLADKSVVRAVKSERLDKTYLAEITFTKNIDKKRLKELKSLEQPILQKTPIRVIHRRADKVRKRLVKTVDWKLLGPRKLLLRIRTESGLYIKELITGDEGRTRPSVCELLNNKVKKISLDVIKIHTK
jgi:tRNA pseudouridine synthase 10